MLNLKHAANSIAPLVEGEPVPELAGAEGEAPCWLQSADAPALVRDVADAVATLVREGVPMSEIAILYAHSRMEGLASSLPESLLEAVEARGVMARWVARDTTSKRYFDITTDSVCISTIHSAKGLDFSHVFLRGMDRLQPEKPRQRRLAYVGMTRAREHLTLAICGREGLVPVLTAAER